MSGIGGIIEFKGSLIRADCVIYAEQVDDDVEVYIKDMDENTIIFKNCTLDDFKCAWRRAVTY